jgi:hypothetical protein
MFSHTPLDRIDRLLKEVAALKPDAPASPTVLEALRCIMQTCNVQDAALPNLPSNTSPRSHASTASNASNTSGKSKASSPNTPLKPQHYVMTRSPTLYNKTLYL